MNNPLAFVFKNIIYYPVTFEDNNNNEIGYSLSDLPFMSPHPDYPASRQYISPAGTFVHKFIMYKTRDDAMNALFQEPGEIVYAEEDQIWQVWEIQASFPPQFSCN